MEEVFALLVFVLLSFPLSNTLNKTKPVYEALMADVTPSPQSLSQLSPFILTPLPQPDPSHCSPVSGAFSPGDCTTLCSAEENGGNFQLEQVG